MDKGLNWKKASSGGSYTQGENHLFLIGVDAYQHCGKLLNAVRDAEALAELLQQRYDFSSERTQVLLDKAATKKAIYSGFRKCLRELRPEDNLVIFFSGHGYFDTDLDEGYWVPVDAHYGAVDEYISFGEIRKFLRAIPSRHIFIIADSCYSGTMFSRVRSPLQRFAGQPSRWMLASGRNEVVPDGVEGGNSPFTSNLLKFLRENDLPELLVSDLVNFVKLATARNSAQTPIGNPLDGAGDKGGEYILLLKKPREEDEIWREIAGEGSLAAFNRYLDKFPNGPYAEEALEQIRVLEAQDRWARISARNSIYELRLFLRDYPDSPFASKARAKISELLNPASSEEAGTAEVPPGGKTTDEREFQETLEEAEKKGAAGFFYPFSGGIEKEEKLGQVVALDMWGSQSRLAFQGGEPPWQKIVWSKPNKGRDYLTSDRDCLNLMEEVADILKGHYAQKFPDIVLTIPAFLSINDRNRLLNLAREAGLSIIRIIHRSTALAVSYYKSKGDTDEVLMVVDKGHAWAEVSILEIGDGVFETEAIKGVIQSKQEKKKGNAPFSQEEILSLAQEAFGQTKMKPEDLNAVIISPGAEKLPGLSSSLKEKFGLKVLKAKSENGPVVGAAQVASLLDGRMMDILLLEMLPISLGIKTFGGVNTTLIPAGTTLPSIKSEIFSTADDNQASVEIHVLQGENEKADDNETVIKAVLSGIPLEKKGVPQIEVRFDLDANSFLTVSARELVTGKEIQVRVE